ncbi:MAG: oligoendopeptidase F [Calditrichaceae bacterium]|jgi:oligoendopeptidase F
MQRLIGVFVIFTLMCSTLYAGNGDTGKSRDQIQEKYKWDLTDLYASNDAWQAAKTDLENMIGEFGQYKGTLANSADQLYNCLQLMSDAYKKYYRLSNYASRLSDQDTRKSKPLGMTQKIGQTGTKLSAATSFIDPEILAIESQTIDKFMKQKPELKEYAHYIDDIQRLKPHTRSAEEEEIISQAGLMSDTPYDIYGIFKNADMPRPEVKLPEGKDVRLDDAAYTLYRANDDREFRQKVFEDFFGAYKQYERTFGTQLYSEVKKDIFYKNVRKYDSCLESALNANNIPVEVYHKLIKSVHDNLATLYRYLELRKKMLGVDELHYYDMYPSLVKEVDLSYSVEQAEDLLKKALKPLGSDYLATLNKAFNNRWIDIFPNTGKRSGAYSSGSAYDVHPYILMNYNGKYEDVSTMAHELGHTMHSFYSNKNQTFLNAQYPIFLAEVASTCNEALLMDYVLKNLKDPQERLSLLGTQLETFRTTLFRQTQFAEFELKIHEQAEAGEALTGEDLTKLYLDILKTYYGDAEGVTVIDDLYGIEWAYIPHFYYNFYVFQYSTSLCASNAISEKILNDEDSMKKKYVKEFLSAGSSDYAIPILKRVGVDMTTTEPYELAFEKMNKIMDEIEQIIEK